MARFIAALIRHGDYHQLANTPSALQPFPLTKKGKQQALDAGKNIAQTLTIENWSLACEMDSSHLLRAWQTATIIRQQFTQLEHKSFETLSERSVGSVANLTEQQISQIVKKDPRYPNLPENWKSDSSFRLPFQGAESLLEAGERVARHINLRMSVLRYYHKEDTVKLFVGHGAAFRHAAYHLGVLNFNQIAQLSMYHCQPVYLELLPNNTWKHIQGSWKIRTQHSSYTD